MDDITSANASNKKIPKIVIRKPPRMFSLWDRFLASLPVMLEVNKTPIVEAVRIKPVSIALYPRTV
jgi:hypothetical protein